MLVKLALGFEHRIASDAVNTRVPTVDVLPTVMLYQQLVPET